MLALSVEASSGGPKATSPIKWHTDDGPPDVANNSRLFAFGVQPEAAQHARLFERIERCGRGVGEGLQA
ncbi:MAG: hypothetical protein ACRBN8_40450 [Nannocystales bacterium]